MVSSVPQRISVAYDRLTEPKIYILKPFDYFPRPLGFNLAAVLARREENSGRTGLRAINLEFVVQRGAHDLCCSAVINRKR
jgi:hypothetical protein